MWPNQCIQCCAARRDAAFGPKVHYWGLNGAIWSPLLCAMLWCHGCWFWLPMSWWGARFLPHTGGWKGFSVYERWLSVTIVVSREILWRWQPKSIACWSLVLSHHYFWQWTQGKWRRTQIPLLHRLYVEGACFATDFLELGFGSADLEGQFVGYPLVDP